MATDWPWNAMARLSVGRPSSGLLNTTMSPALRPPRSGPGLNSRTVLPRGTAGSMLSELTVIGSRTHKRVASRQAARTAAVVVFRLQTCRPNFPPAVSGGAAR